MFEVGSDHSTLLRGAKTGLECLCKLLQVLRADTHMRKSRQPRSTQARGTQAPGHTHQGAIAVGVEFVEGFSRFVFQLHRAAPPSAPRLRSRIGAPQAASSRRPVSIRTPSCGCCFVHDELADGAGRTESWRCCEEKAPAPCCPGITLAGAPPAPPRAALVFLCNAWNRTSRQLRVKKNCSDVVDKRISTDISSRHGRHEPLSGFNVSLCSCLDASCRPLGMSDPDMTPAHPPLYTPMSVEGQTVLITGATAGIGEATAWRFAEAGARLVLLGRRTERLEALKGALSEAYPSLPEVCCVTFDVQEIAKIGELPTELPESHRCVDILVNNAGLALGVAGVAENDMEHVRQMIDTNVTAVMAFTRAFVPGMRSRGRGHLINIGSIAGHECYSGGSVYCATKHAIDAFTTAARHDLLGTPIRVTAISPGLVNTEFSMIRYGDKSSADKLYENISPLVAADIADNVMYAATRPKHVQIADMIVLATNQAAAKALARVGQSLGGPQ